MAVPPLGQIQNPEDIYKTLEDQTIGESSLTDQELQDRLQQYQNLSSQQIGGNVDIDKLTANVHDRLLGLGVPQEAISRIMPGLANVKSSADLVGLFSKTFGDSQSPVTGAIGDAVSGLASDIDKGTYTVPVGTEEQNVAPDIKRLQDLIGSRTNLEQGQASIDNLVTNLPGQLDANTQQFVGDLQAQGQQSFEQNLAPEILADLNSRGLLQSGDLETSLASGAADIQSGIEQQQADLMAQDSAFYENAAYQNQLQKTLAAGGDASAQAASDTAQATQNQANNFSAAQKTLNQSLQEKLYRKQQDRALRAQQDQLERLQNQQEKSQKAAQLKGIGTAIGTIGGAALGGPVGSIVGGQLGGSAGGLFT